MPQYTDLELVESFQRAVQLTQLEPGELIGRASERAVTHRIALHLQTLFPHHQVDCEYNRNGVDAKTVSISAEGLTAEERETLVRESTTRRVSREAAEQLTEFEFNPFPDIIVHRRLKQDANLLIAEVKIVGNQRGVAFDVAKVKAYTRAPYHYQLGVVAVLDRMTMNLTWFQGGQEVTI